MTPLSTTVLPREDLTAAQKQEMLSLMQHCYEGVSAARFQSDLDDKQHVILLRTRESNEIVGFSTIRVSEELLGNRRVSVVYSGDTVIHPDRWGGKALQRAFSRFVLGHKLRRPWQTTLWLLLSGGYKTYLLLINNVPRSFPRRGTEFHPQRVQFRDDLSRRWFGNQYDAARGIVRFAEPHYRVRASVVPIDEATAALPDVAFFLKCNPGHVGGDELVCLGELRFRDLIRTWLRSLWRSGAVMLFRRRRARTPQALGPA
jgi:hypothetical protein